MLLKYIGNILNYKYFVMIKNEIIIIIHIIER